MRKKQWDSLKDLIKESVGASNYKNWIAPLELGDVVDGVAVFYVPTPFIGSYVSSNFGEVIRYQISRIIPDVRRIDFHVRPRQAPAQAPAQLAECAATDQLTIATKKSETKDSTAALSATAKAAPEDLVSAPIDPRFTFQNFVVGKPNELAHAAARRVSEAGAPTFNPLFLHGGVGLGKTHLMHAIAWELRARHPHLNVVYLSAEQFMYRFVQALRDRKMMDFKQLFRSVDILMVDDVQFIAGKDSTQEEFFHTFNALIDQQKQIIISADRAPDEIDNLEERIKSRLQCGLVADLHPTDYELRLGVLQAKANYYRGQYPDLKIADGILEFLAHRISTNVRVLEGALTRLYAFASLMGHEVTMELTMDCLSDVLRKSDRKVSVEEIQRKVAEHYNIRLADMIGPRRVRVLTRPRQVAMYLCKQLTQRSLPEIGRRFGGRDHTTVMHGVRRIEELSQKDAQIADDIELLRRALEQ